MDVIIGPWRRLSAEELMLENTLESPLDYKEIRLVNPKGNQPWIFIWKTDVEAEAPILWPPDAKRSVQFSSVAQSCPTLQIHEPQQTRPTCPSQTPGVHPNPCPSSWWCHPTISSSVVPFPSCPQSFPASGYFQMSQLFTSGGQSIGVSASASVLPMDAQGWFPLGWAAWISLQSKKTPQESSLTPWFKSINSLVFSFLYSPTLTSIHDHWKNHSLDQTK